MRWLPNILAASRLVLLVPVMWLAAIGQNALSYRIAFAVFLVASLTEALDGWAARRFSTVGNLGTFVDPLADKVFANVLLVFLACRQPAWVPLWMVLLLLAREFAVQGFRSMAPCVGVVIRTERTSKLKLVLQLVMAGAALTGVGWSNLEAVLKPVAWVSLALALAAGYTSMFSILRKNADLWSRRPRVMEIR